MCVLVRVRVRVRVRVLVRVRVRVRVRVFIYIGGVASKKVRDIGLALTRAKETFNLIFLCGRNLKLMEELKAVYLSCY